MDNKSFDTQRIAEGYAKRPWLHKCVIENLKQDCNLPASFMFSNGLDVGCGAGLSTRALKLICNQVTGTDISKSMINVCKELFYGNKDYTFYVSKAEETRVLKRKYDIVTASGMIDWVDEKSFLNNMLQITTEDCYILIYDFWITDRMSGVPHYTTWYQEEYLKRFLKPPRKERVWSQEDMIGGLQIYKQTEYEFRYTFSLDAFVEFMMIQSNINIKIENGEISETQIREWMKESLYPYFNEFERTLIFDGYSWYIKRM